MGTIEHAPTTGGARAAAATRASRVAVDARLVVTAAAATYAALFTVTAAVHYLAFEEARFDLGNMVQTVWSTAHGDLLGMTSLTGEHGVRLGSHVDPFLALLVPLWWVWSSPLMLLVVQALAVTSGVYPVYRLARKHLGTERAAGHFAFAYLLFPATQFNAFTVGTGFHSVSIAVPLLLYAIWFLDEKRLVPFAVCAVVAASTKEEIPAAVACLGIWYAVRKGRRIAGGLIFAGGVAACVANFLVIIPHFAASGAEPFADRYAGVGGTPGGILRTAFTDPLALLQVVASWHKLVFVALLLVPLLGLWAFEPLLLLGAAPDLVVNLLSSKPQQTDIQFHYTAGIIPFVFAAAIVGAGRTRWNPDRISFYALAGSAMLMFYSPIFLASHDFGVVTKPNPAREAKAHAVGLVPDGVPVAASNQLAGYLSARKRIFVFPYVRNSEWVVVDRHDPTYINRAGYRAAITRIERRSDWRLVFSGAGVEVLQKR